MHLTARKQVSVLEVVLVLPFALRKLRGPLGSASEGEALREILSTVFPETPAPSKKSPRKTGPIVLLGLHRPKP